MRSRTVRPYVLLPDPRPPPTHYSHPCWVDPLGTCFFTSWTSELQDGPGCLTNRVGFRMVSGCKRSWERKIPSPACLTLLVGGPQTQFQRVACVLSHFSRVRLFVTPWTVARQAPRSMGFSRHEHWSGLPCPPPGLADPHLLRLLHCKWVLYH